MKLFASLVALALSGCAYVSQAQYDSDVAHHRFGAPAGTIAAFAGDAVPDGWLPCDGAAYKADEYPELYSAIKNTYGANPTNAKDFFVPDYRGYFLRGVDGGTNRDADAASRSPMRAGASSGAKVGSVQPDSLQDHGHVEDAPGHSHSAQVSRNLMSGSNGTQDVERGGEKYNSDPNLGSLGVTIGATQVGVKAIIDTGAEPARHGRETRPKNVAVMWIIKK